MVRPHPTVNGFINLLKERQGNFYNPTVSNFPIVFIISSFYNAHRYFEENYESVMNQTFQNFEWIIVDDCSTESESITLLKSLSQKSPKIKVIYHQYNQGVSAGRNTAIAQATGKYLFFTDLDDILDPTYIEKCVLFLESNPEFSFVNSYSVGFQDQEYWWNHGFNKPSQFLQRNWVTGRLLYRKADFDKLGGFDEQLRFYEDWERWLKAITNHQKGWTIPEYLDCYRRSKLGLLSSSCNNTSEEKRVTELIQSRYQDFFQENTLADVSIKRLSPFDVNLIRTNFQVKNVLNRKSSGKQILCFFPHLEIGGADKFNLDLVTLLANREYNITIVTTLKTSDHPWHHHFYSVTPDIFHLSNFLNDSYWLAFTRSVIESRQIDIVLISNSYIAYHFLPILRVEFPHIAFVDYTHAYDPGWRGNGYPRISCQVSQFLDYQIVSSNHLAKFYQDMKQQTKDKLKVCYTNVDTDKWLFDSEIRKEIRLSLGITDETILVLFPARIVPQKRPLFLVDIIKRLVSESLLISVIVLGDGYLLPEMKAKINQLGLESFFQMLPPVNPEKMLDFYSACDILLLPSEYEGISIAMYEAMSMQLPVVASEVGGQAELVTPETGFLIPKGNGDASEVNEYIKVLTPLIKNADLRKKVGSLARQRVSESFSLEKMCDRMEAIFTEAIKLRKNTPLVEVDLAIAEEMLTIALEFVHQEELLGNLWNNRFQLEQEKNNLFSEKLQLQQENQELLTRKNAMETSKFWKLRKLWFKIKRTLKIPSTQE